MNMDRVYLKERGNMNSEDLRDIVKVEWWEDNRYLVVFGSGNEYIVELNVMVDWFNNKMKEYF